MSCTITIEQLESLPPAERAELEALLVDRYGGQDLRDYLTDNFAHQPPPRHAAPIITLLEEARHNRVKALISMPPRHTKTTILLRAVGWWLKRDPADTCGYFSYSDRQGRSKSRLARDWAAAYGPTLSKETNDVAEWRTTSGGGLLAGGAGGGLTGQGISGLMIVDDPFKNRAEADSKLIRDRVHEWFNEVTFTRLEGASVIVVQTRWHDDDLIGRLSEDPTWLTINIPAIAEQNDVLGRAPGEALWPEKFPIAELEAIRAQIGEWSFAALYQGRPRPRGGQLFGEPTSYGKYPDLDGVYILIACDPAATAKTRADYSAIVVASGKRRPDGLLQIDILDVIRLQVEIPVLVNHLVATQRKWGAPVAIEAVGGFKAVPQSLRAIDRRIRVIELNPTGDKFTRALPVVAAWNDGRVRCPIDAPWLADFLDEVRSFTGVADAHDDQVDGLAHVYNQLDAMTRTAGRRRVVSARALPFG